LQGFLEEAVWGYRARGSGREAVEGEAACEASREDVEGEGKEAKARIVEERVRDLNDASLTVDRESCSSLPRSVSAPDTPTSHGDRLQADRLEIASQQGECHQLQSMQRGSQWESERRLGGRCDKHSSEGGLRHLRWGATPHDQKHLAPLPPRQRGAGRVYTGKGGAFEQIGTGVGGWIPVPPCSVRPKPVSARARTEGERDEMGRPSRPCPMSARAAICTPFLVQVCVCLYVNAVNVQAKLEAQQ